LRKEQVSFFRVTGSFHLLAQIFTKFKQDKLRGTLNQTDSHKRSADLAKTYATLLHFLLTWLKEKAIEDALLKYLMSSIMIPVWEQSLEGAFNLLIS
jgi:hypothetical protein